MSHYKVSVRLSKNLKRTILLIAETRAEALVKAEMFLKNSGEQNFLIYEAEEIIPNKLGILCWQDSLPSQNKADIVTELFGSVPDGISLEEAIKEKLNKI